MVEDLDRSRSDNVGKAPWLKIFMGFKLALDPKKLLLAAAGIFVAYIGWWAISFVFYGIRSVPSAEGYNQIKSEDVTGKEAYLADATSWSMLHILAGTPVPQKTIDEWEKIKNSEIEAGKPNLKIEHLIKAMNQPYGKLRQCPWNEDRGPNQFLVASQVVQRGEFYLGRSDAMKYLEFSVEPLFKFLTPVTYFFDGRVGGMLSWNRFYLIAILFWMIMTWGIFGGAITRMACVQLARNEKVGLRESMKFVMARWQGYVFAPVLPMAALLVLSLCLWVFGLFFGITFALGDIIGGLIWPITMITGLIMSVILVGLLGWPLMNATISTEGSDSFDALSRSYSYVYQVPWHCLWYTAVSLFYGAVLVFFVGFMGTLIVYLGNWGVAQAYFFESRDPAFLCVDAPTSFGWRDALLKNSPNAEFKDGHYRIPEDKIPKEWYKHTSLGTYLVTFWLGLFFLLILGFGYSFFWTAATIIYLLLRQKVDDTDLDEVYLEEEEEKPFMPEGPAPGSPPAGSPPATPAANNTPPATKFTMVDLSTSIRPSEPPPAAEPPSAPPVTFGDPPPPAPHADPDAGPPPSPGM
jgi:hypothetical protein